MSDTPIEKWSNDDLISRTDLIASSLVISGHTSSAVVLRELARRYRIMVEAERTRWESARQAFGPGVGPKEVGE